MAGVYIYSDNPGLAAELVGFAKASGEQSFLFTLDEEAVKNCGATKIYGIKGASPMIESYASALADFLKQEQAGLLAVGATARGRDLAARVAGYLDCGMVSDVTTASFIDGKLTASRMVYGGVIQQSEILEGLSVVTIPPGRFDPASGTGEIEVLALAADERIKLQATSPIVKEGGDLSRAERVVCVGMAFDQEAELDIARDLTQVLSAEMGCTRGIAEERHWLPAENYIGISGAVIKPALYISMGVSGQIQHVYGIRDAKIIVAVDTNEKAPIFKAADYGIVGDMHEIIPALTKALRG